VKGYQIGLVSNIRMISPDPMRFAVGINLEEAIAGFKRMDTNIFTDKGIELLRSLDDLLNDWDFFDSKYRETIYEAVDMTGLDISNIGYEDDK